MQQLKSHIEAQTARPLLWIACAGIDRGKAEHFELSYLTTVLPQGVHNPIMDMPLRNTKQTLAMAGLEANKDVKGLNYDGARSSTKTNPVYKLPANLLEGVTGKPFLYNNDDDDDDEMANVVEAACKEVLGRTGGAGFPILCEDYSSDISVVKRGVERAGATAIVYHKYSNDGVYLRQKSCSEAEVEEWLRRRRSGKEEKRCLIADEQVSRGWEASHVMDVDLYGTGGMENLVMRAVGFCALVKKK